MRAGMHKAHLIARAAFVVLAAVIMAVAATFLPDNPYERFQLLEGTIYARARWAYERMHFDPKPIDVLIVGSSKAMLGLRSAEIERQLAAAGKPAAVVNLAMEGDGRNVQWLLVREALKTKQPKVIVLAINDQPHPWGHDSFHLIASSEDIWQEAFHGLHDTKKDLMYLPFRQMRLSAAMLFPGPFGLQPRFDPVRYAAIPDEFPERHQNAAGEWIDVRGTKPREELLAAAEAHDYRFDRHSKLPAAVRAITDADDRVYTDMIAKAAAARGVKLLFVYQPGFNRTEPIVNRAYYQSLGAIQDSRDLYDKDTLFFDWVHLNTAGARIMSDRVADAVVKLLP
jgi:hypothetical protein